MKTLTDRDMLAAAERALREHMALRPATSQELAAQAAAEDEEAARLESADELLPKTPTISECIAVGERGEHVIAMQHQLGQVENRRVKDTMERKRLAAGCRMRAAALRDAASLGDGEQYTRTLGELQARVEFYAQRVEAARG